RKNLRHHPNAEFPVSLLYSPYLSYMTYTTYNVLFGTTRLSALCTLQSAAFCRRIKHVRTSPGPGPQALSVAPRGARSHGVSRRNGRGPELAALEARAGFAGPPQRRDRAGPVDRSAH